MYPQCAPQGVYRQYGCGPACVPSVHMWGLWCVPPVRMWPACVPSGRVRLPKRVWYPSTDRRGCTLCTDLGGVKILQRSQFRTGHLAWLRRGRALSEWFQIHTTRWQLPSTWGHRRDQWSRLPFAWRRLLIRCTLSMVGSAHDMAMAAHSMMPTLCDAAATRYVLAAAQGLVAAVHYTVTCATSPRLSDADVGGSCPPHGVYIPTTP